MSEKIVKVTLIEEQEKQGSKAAEFSHLEQLASRLKETEKLLGELKAKLSEAEKELEEFKLKSSLEKRLSDLTGTPFKDLTPELEQKVKSLREQLENLSSEKTKLRNEVLKGLSNVHIPIEINGLTETTEEETFFKFRNGNRYPSITTFIKKELKFSNPPVYVTITPEGVRVVGLTERTVAIKELVKTIESLHARANNELKPQTTQELSEKLTPESQKEFSDTTMPSLLKKAKKHFAVSL